jgi:hypothetical protein
MKFPFSALSAGAAVLASACAQQGSPQQGSPQQGTPATPPRLVVLCAVDQLASWVFEQGKPWFADDGGFRRLLREGVQFQKCEYEHACTETGPGHATIGTGVAANVHGIVRNKWWVPAQRLAIYCVDEPMAPLADLLEGRDRGPGLMLAPTLVTAVEQGVPGTITASISWKDRSAILMAGPAANAVVWFEATTGRFVTNSAWAKATPAWLTELNRQRLADEFHGQQWQRTGPEAAYDGLVDDRPYELPHGNGSGKRTLPQVVNGASTKPCAEFYAQLYGSPFGNTVVRQAAEAMVRGMQLGADATTDVLCVSFSSTDVVGHVFGPESVEARDTLLRLDRELATFLQFLDAQVGKGQWAMFVTADHGVGTTPEWARAQGLDAGRGPIQTMAGALAEKVMIDRHGPSPSGSRYLTHVGEYSIYFDDARLEAVRGTRSLADVRLEAARLVAAALPKVRGITSAFATADLLAPDGAPDALRQCLVKGLSSGRAGDVQLVVQANWLDGTTPASHGTPHAYDREVTGLAIGGGAPAGAVESATITPGFGAVWFRELLGLPRPAGAVDVVPASFQKTK